VPDFPKGGGRGSRVPLPNMFVSTGIASFIHATSSSDLYRYLTKYGYTSS
jgi:hypothetical protein